MELSDFPLATDALSSHLYDPFHRLEWRHATVPDVGKGRGLLGCSRADSGTSTRVLDARGPPATSCSSM